MEAKKKSLPETQQGTLPRALPGQGEFCRDAEGNMYQIIGHACHSKTGEEMVIYQALYGDYRWYACPALEFCLEKASVASEFPTSDSIKESEQTEQKQEKGEKSQIKEELLLFLDAEDTREKLVVLRAIRAKLDESLLTSIELSLDLIPDEKESLERRLDLIERTLEKRAKYECSRLRGR